MAIQMPQIVFALHFRGHSHNVQLFLVWKLRWDPVVQQSHNPQGV